MKKCFKCGETKSFNDFYKHKKTKDGYLNKCKDCARNDTLRHRAENIEKVREYDRNRPNHKERVEARKKRMQDIKENNPALYEKYKKSAKKWNTENKHKRNAHNKVARALFNGKIKRRSDCEVCGSDEKIEAHHHDYSKPLDVIWLCVKCHKQEHKTEREKQRSEHTGNKED